MPGRIIVGSSNAENALISKVGEFTVSGSVSQVRKLIYMRPDDVADLADRRALATAPAIAFVLALPYPGKATLLYFGKMTGFIGLIPGETMFLGENGDMIPSSLLDVRAGRIVQQIGVVLDSTSVLFQPQPLLEM